MVTDDLFPTRLDLPAARDRAVERLRRELETLVRVRGVTQRDIERRNGFHRGYLSQVLKGHIALTARHLFGILLAVDVPPAEFFRHLFADETDESGGGVPLDEIRQRLARYDAAFEQLEAKGLLDPNDRRSGK